MGFSNRPPGMTAETRRADEDAKRATREREIDQTLRSAGATRRLMLESDALEAAKAAQEREKRQRIAAQFDSGALQLHRREDDADYVVTLDRRAETMPGDIESRVMDLRRQGYTQDGALSLARAEADAHQPPTQTRERIQPDPLLQRHAERYAAEATGRPYVTPRVPDEADPVGVAILRAMDDAKADAWQRFGQRLTDDEALAIVTDTKPELIGAWRTSGRRVQRVGGAR
jgi:hypothetical protein